MTPPKTDSQGRLCRRKILPEWFTTGTGIHPDNAKRLKRITILDPDKAEAWIAKQAANNPRIKATRIQF